MATNMLIKKQVATQYLFMPLPIKDAPQGRMYCEAIYDDTKGFRIFLQGQDKNKPFLKISFDSELAYRKIDEGDFLKTTVKQALGKGRALIYVSKESEFIEWFHIESAGIYDGREIQDFLIVSANDCVEILAFEAPFIEWTDVIS